MPVHWIRPGSYFANAFVYGPVLIDAGVYPMAVEPFKEQIETIILTHCHFDHIAHVAQIQAMCNAEVCIHHDDAEGLTEDKLNLSPMFAGRFTPVIPDRILHGGERIGELTVIHTPGHTPGSISLYDEEKKVLFSGDTLFSDGGFGRTDFIGGSVIDLHASIERLAELQVTGLYPGHGLPVEKDGAQHIEAARRSIAIYG